RKWPQLTPRREPERLLSQLGWNDGQEPCVIKAEDRICCFGFSLLSTCSLVPLGCCTIPACNGSRHSFLWRCSWALPSCMGYVGTVGCPSLSFSSSRS